MLASPHPHDDFLLSEGFLRFCLPGCMQSV